MKKYTHLFLVFFTLFFTSCTFNKFNSRTDLIVTDQNKAFVTGQIILNTQSKKPYYLMLYKVVEKTKDKYIYELVDFSTHIQNENFSFSVKTGSYFLYACQNQEIISEKRLGFQYYSDYITLTKEKNKINLNVKMSKEVQEVSDDNVLIETLNQKSLSKKISFTQNRTLDDNIFKRKNSSLGLWNPEKFSHNVGGGIYMIGEYDKNKIPILFIHGMNGTPTDFTSIINSIDKNKFQAWVYYYPTGLNLNFSVDFLKTAMDYIKIKYSINKLILVSHSMGGLVARGFINIYKNKLEIPIFITLSTPWNGQKFAKLGEDYIKYLPPSFVNMIPQSVFQKKILREKFPDTLKHYLFFGYKGKSSLVLDKSNDGTISLSSQLFETAQNQSSKIYGFNENHISILKSKIVIDKIDEILDTIK